MAFSDMCTDYRPLKIIFMAKNIYQIIIYLIPIIIIVRSCIELYKPVVSGKMDDIKEALKNSLGRFLIGIFVVLLPGIIITLFSSFYNYINEDENYLKICIDNATSENIKLLQEATIYDEDEEDKPAKDPVIKPTENPSKTYDAKFEWEKDNKTGLNYWIDVPKGTTSGASLLVYMHGNSNTGASKKDRLRDYSHFVKAREYAKNNNIITIAPNDPKYAGWSLSEIKDVNKLVDSIANEYNVDKNKIYILGFSGGARAAWTMISAKPGYYSSAVMISGKPYNQYFDAKKASQTDVKAFSGSVAGEVATGNSMDDAVKELKKNGATASYTRKKGTHSGSNGVSTYIDFNKEVFDWLFK